MMRKRYLSPNVRHAVLTRHGILCFLGLDNTFASFKALGWCRLNRTHNRYPHASAPPQHGFTLLEMLVVLGLLGIVMLGTTTLLIDDGDWKRQDETVKRWDEIRKAIIGEPNLSLNGSPYVAGYVADMGRLPQNISELFIQGEQPDWNEAIQLTSFNTDPTNIIAVSGGWRGPYLYTAGSAQYRDGWGNVNIDDNVDDAVNFGWVVNLLDDAFPNHSAIQVQSLGSGNEVSGSGLAEDFPNTAVRIVDVNQWQVNSTIAFNVVFNKPPTCTAPCSEANLDLRIFKFEDDGIADNPPINKSEDSVAVRSSNPQAVDTSATVGTTFSLSSADPVQISILDMFTIGTYAAVVMCTNGTSSLADDVIYDGDCVAPVNKNPTTHLFTILPSTTQVTIPWNLP